MRVIRVIPDILQALLFYNLGKLHTIHFCSFGLLVRLVKKTTLIQTIQSNS